MYLVASRCNGKILNLGSLANFATPKPKKRAKSKAKAAAKAKAKGSAGVCVASEEISSGAKGSQLD